MALIVGSSDDVRVVVPSQPAVAAAAAAPAASISAEILTAGESVVSSLSKKRLEIVAPVAADAAPGDNILVAETAASKLPLSSRGDR